MSYLKPNTAGVYDIPSANIDTLYIKGKKFQQYIDELVIEDQLEQSEITEIKLLLEYLDTTGLNSAWTVTNSNVNETLRTAITALQTKLANIDTTALTETSVLNNDNRNSVLKTAIDTATSDLTALTTRVTTAEGDIDNLETRMTTAEGDIDNLETRETNVENDITAIKAKTDYLEVFNGNPQNSDSTHGINIGSHIYSFPADATKATKKAATLSVGYPGQGFAVHYDEDADDGTKERARVMMYNPFGGHAIVLASHTRISGIEELNIGEVGTGLGASETINIGGAMSSINIGSVENPRIGTGFPIPDSDYNNSTKITIGKRTSLKNTWTYLQGNFYTSESRWEDLAVTDVVTFETAASWFAGYVFSGGLPYWLAWVGLSGTPNYRYSDVVKMANNPETFGATKNHAIETSNDISVQNIRVMDFTVVSLETAFDAILARLVFQAFAVHGSHSIGSIWGRTNIYAGSGEIELRVDGGIFDWAFKNAGNSNRVFLDNDHVEVVQCNGSGGTGRLRLVAANGNIELSTAQGGVRSYATKVMEITYQKQIIIGDDTTMTDATYKMLIDTTSHTNGIKVAKGSDALLLNPDNVSSKSLTLQSGYTGTTANTLYKNADNKLMFNGEIVGAGGVSSGGITYLINVASNITDPNPTPTETIITAAYSGNAQRTITQAITANTAFYIAKYTTEVFDEVTNPVLTGLQQLNQYLVWNSQNHVGQLYGQLWFQATAIGFGVLYQRTYPSPVTTTAATFINGTPIPTPKGLYNIKFQRVLFPNINVVVTSGTVVLRYRVEGLVSGSWTILYSMVGLVPPSFSSTTSGLTITLDESVTLNQTTPGATAVRLVLFISSGTGTISQTSAGGADLAAYSLIGLGVNTPALFRTMLYDGTNAKITIPYSTTPTLVEYDLAIDAPYKVSAFASPTLSTDLYFIQPAGGGHGTNAITLYFNEGSISHYHSTISPPQTAPTLAQVLNSGATASQPINMNTNKISGITSLEGSSNGNWNVKEITAAQGSGISVTATNGSYAIENDGIISITGGTGISVSTTSGVAVITNTAGGATQVGVAQSIRDEHQSLYEVGALPRKPDYWATNWSVADSTSRSHRDIYVSVDGKIIVSALGDFTIRYSTNYGTTWSDATGLSIATTWTSICGTSNGSRLFAFGTFQAQNSVESLVLYTSTTQGATWTQITSSAFTGIIKVNRVRCSGDGTYILASDDSLVADARVLYSNNGGTTWARQEIGDLPSGKTEGVAVSRSGAIQFATWINSAANSSRVLRSIDYGITWSEVFGHIAGGNWTRIETDATGRFVVATRYVNISTPIVETYRSDNYGIAWFSAGISGVEDVWVSATGQFVAGVSNPQAGGISYVVYSTDYGRTFTGVNMTTTTGSSTTYRTINGSADGSILVLGSVNDMEAGFPGDGLLRIARSGVENIYDMLQAPSVLWYITNIKSAGAQNFAPFPINATYGNINFDTHNIEYEIEINWDRHTFVAPSAHIRMGFNDIFSELNTHSSNTTWRFMLEQANVTIHAGNQGAIGYDQHYNNRFYCGYSAVQGIGDQYRYRTFLTGQLSVQRRKQAQTADLGTYSTDWSLASRTLTNRFTSDSYLLENTAANRAKLFSQNDFDNGHHCISGTAVWELTDAGAWESGYGGDLTALKDGIKNIRISFVNNPNYAALSRSFEISARFWRVRK